MVINILARQWERLSGSGYGAVLLRGTLANGQISVVGYGLTFASFTLLARLLGVEQYGVYSVVLSWVALLSLLAGLGVGQALLRYLAAYRVREAFGELRGLLHWSQRLVFGSSVVLALLTALALYLLRGRLQPALVHTFIPACLAIPIITQVQLRSLSLRALRRFALAVVPEQVIKPLLLMGGVLGIGRYLGGVDSVDAMWVALLAALVSLLFMERWLRSTLPRAIGRVEPVRHDRQWLSTALPLLIVSGMHLVQSETDIVMLGWLAGTEQAGIYSAASRVSGVVAFGLAMVNGIAAPLFSELYAQQRLQRLQRLVSLAAVAVTLSMLPLIGVIALWGEWILQWFGEPFTAAYQALLILSAGQLVNAICGSVGYLLTMTGYQTTAATALSISAVLNVLGNALLIPLFGILGAALTTAATMVLWNLIMVYQVRRRLDIRPTIFAAWGVMRG